LNRMQKNMRASGPSFCLSSLGGKIEAIRDRTPFLPAVVVLDVLEDARPPSSPSDGLSEAAASDEYRRVLESGREEEDETNLAVEAPVVGTRGTM
jgi:hypothetical protein